MTMCMCKCCMIFLSVNSKGSELRFFPSGYNTLNPPSLLNPPLRFWDFENIFYIKRLTNLQTVLPMLFNKNIAKINELESVASVYLYQKNSLNVIKTTIFPYIFAKSKLFEKPAVGADFGGCF